jgi:hypothetical protein
MGESGFLNIPPAASSFQSEAAVPPSKWGLARKPPLGRGGGERSERGRCFHRIALAAIFVNLRRDKIVGNTRAMILLIKPGIMEG